MRLRAYLLANALVLGPVAGGHATDAPAVEPEAHDTRLFPRPAALEPAVKFWRSIFTEYSGHQVVLHDAVYLDKVYKVLDFRPHLEAGMEAGELASLERLE